MTRSEQEQDNLAHQPMDVRELSNGPHLTESSESLIGLSWLGEIVSQLDKEPEECWLAMESLIALDDETRAEIIEELSAYKTNVGVQTLLHLLSTGTNLSTRETARRAFPEVARPAAFSTGVGFNLIHQSATLGDLGNLLHPNFPTGFEIQTSSHNETDALAVAGNRIVRALVTPVDGQGRGTIVVSSSQVGQRRTAAFWCDIQNGILDVVGEVEAESPSAGQLINECIERTGGDVVCDVPELAVRLLGGSLLLSGKAISAPARIWLDGILSPEFEPSTLLGGLPDYDTSSILEEEMLARAYSILDACPTWLDRSSLTFELAEEILLREGTLAPDPIRDSGAYRFLFEHLLIHRLEMYRRMLLWMAWFWQGSGLPDLSKSAFLLACQLSDEQYEVPSHPFTVALSTRSLEAAQYDLRSVHNL